MLSSVPVLMRITIVTGPVEVLLVPAATLITTLSFGPSVSFASIGNVVVVDAVVEAEPAGAVVATVEDDADPDDPAIVEEVEDDAARLVDGTDDGAPGARHVLNAAHHDGRGAG